MLCGEVTLGLAPLVPWQQYVIAFDDFFSALAAAEKIALDDEIKKRLVTVFEWPIPSYFIPPGEKGRYARG